MSLHPLRRDEQAMGHHALRLSLEYLVRPDRCVKVARGTEVGKAHGERGVTGDKRIDRAQSQRVLSAFDGFLVRAPGRERRAKKCVRQRKVRIQFQRSMERLLRLSMTAHAPQRYPVCQMCPGISFVEAERCTGLRNRLRQNGPE